MKKIQVIFAMLCLLTALSPEIWASDHLKREKIRINTPSDPYTLDLTMPGRNSRMPAVIIINGFSPDSFAEAGFMAVSGNIRDNTVPEIIDAVRRHPQSSKKIGITGHSWGAAMAMVTAAQTRRIDAVVEIAGLLHPSNNIDISKDIPCPILFICGEKDTLAPPDRTGLLYEAHKKSGFPSEILIMKNQGHGFDEPSKERILEKSIEFLKKHLK